MTSANPRKTLQQLKRSMTPDEFVEKLRPHILEAMRYQQLAFFASTFAPKLGAFEARSRRQYAAVLILLGRYDEATAQLRQSLQSARHEAHARDTTLLLDTLTKDSAAAVALLGEWEAETKRKFNIP